MLSRSPARRWSAAKLTGEKYVLEGLRVPAYGCYYMEQEQSRESAEAEPADA